MGKCGTGDWVSNRGWGGMGTVQSECCGPVAGCLFVFIVVAEQHYTLHVFFGTIFFSAYLLRLTGTRCRLGWVPSKFS